MSKLLVSVRDATEAVAALAGGADIIDVKEPTRGSLGMADGEAVAGVVEAVGDRAPVSVALGETCEWLDLQRPVRVPATIQYAKLGLFHLGSGEHWEHEWLDVRGYIDSKFSNSHRWIAVAYVDWQTAVAPSPEEVIAVAARTKCAGVLFDTYSKSNGSLLDYLSLPELTQQVAAIREAGILAALAGGIAASEAAQLVSTGADILAIRTAACEGGRNGTVTESAVRRFHAAMDSQDHVVAAAVSHPAAD